MKRERVGRISLSGITLNVWDIGGQRAIRPYWSNYYPGTHAVIYVVDASDVKRWIEKGNDWGWRGSLDWMRVMSNWMNYWKKRNWKEFHFSYWLINKWDINDHLIDLIDRFFTRLSWGLDYSSWCSADIDHVGIIEYQRKSLADTGSFSSLRGIFITPLELHLIELLERFILWIEF